MGDKKDYKSLIIIMVLLIITVGVAVIIALQIKDSQEIRINLHESEQAELYGVPEFSDIAIIQEQIREYKLGRWKVEQHRLELERMVKDYEANKK